MYENQQHIESIVREMLKSLCTVSIAFSVELRLQGTLGITVDGKDTHLIQLDERILSNTSNGVQVVPTDLVIPESIVKVERDDPAYQFGHLAVSEPQNNRHHVVAPIDNQPSQTCQTITLARQGQCGTSNVGADCSVISSHVAESDSQQLARIPQPVNASLNPAVSTEKSKSVSQGVIRTNVCQLPHDSQLSKCAVVKLKRLDAHKYLANGCSSLGIAKESDKSGKLSRVRLLRNDEYIYESPCTPRERKRPRLADSVKEEKWAGGVFQRWCDSTGKELTPNSLSDRELRELISSFYKYAASAFDSSTISCLRSGLKRYFATVFHRNIDTGSS